MVGSGNRLDGSVSQRVVKRESNVVKHYHDKDWSKLGQWGAEYEVKNSIPVFTYRLTVHKTRRFERLFVSLGNSIDISYGCGLKFVSVDVTFSNHSTYRQDVRVTTFTKI